MKIEEYRLILRIKKFIFVKFAIAYVREKSSESHNYHLSQPFLVRMQLILSDRY